MADKTHRNYRFPEWLEAILPLEKALRCINNRGMHRRQADICQQVAYILEVIKGEGKEISPQYAFGVLRKTILKFWEKERSDRSKIESYATRKASPASSSDCLSPLKTLVAQEEAHLLCQLMSRLDDEDRLILILYFDHELTFKTIARILGYKSDRTISLKYKKTIAKLGKWMKNASH